jgi:acetylornithine deacetylase/succinyl-diaminopimelate desuccinylase-like protein
MAGRAGIPMLQPAARTAVPEPVGIPTYGVSGLYGDRDGDGVHGLNERMRVKSLMEGREFLYRLVKIYADQP